MPPNFENYATFNVPASRIVDENRRPWFDLFRAQADAVTHTHMP